MDKPRILKAIISWSRSEGAPLKCVEPMDKNVEETAILDDDLKEEFPYKIKEEVEETPTIENGDCLSIETPFSIKEEVDFGESEFLDGDQYVKTAEDLKKVMSEAEKVLLMARIRKEIELECKKNRRPSQTRKRNRQSFAMRKVQFKRKLEAHLNKYKDILDTSKLF